MCKSMDWHRVAGSGPVAECVCQKRPKDPKTRPVQRYRLKIRSGSVEMEGSPSGKLASRSNHDGNVNDTWLVCEGCVSELSECHQVRPPHQSPTSLVS